MQILIIYINSPAHIVLKKGENRSPDIFTPLRGQFYPRQ